MEPGHTAGGIRWERVPIHGLERHDTSTALPQPTSPVRELDGVSQQDGRAIGRREPFCSTLRSYQTIGYGNLFIGREPDVHARFQSVTVIGAGGPDMKSAVGISLRPLRRR